jgi:hypothetical protein
MKFSATILAATLASVSAFTATTPAKTISSLRMADVAPEEPEPEPVLPAMSESMPFMERPAALKGENCLLCCQRDLPLSISCSHSSLFTYTTGELAGDVGFDPLGFAKDEYELRNYREAEIKHARLAMLAAAGWPLSELFDKQIANALHLEPALNSADRVPSVLNGGLDKISPIYWVAVVAMAGAIDVFGIQQQGKPGYVAGNLGFDPLGLMPKDEEGKKWMQTAELKNGRLAMIAITAFAVQEAVTKLGVVDETPIFFKPLLTALHEQANAGYIMH